MYVSMCAAGLSTPSCLMWGLCGWETWMAECMYGYRAVAEDQSPLATERRAWLERQVEIGSWPLKRDSSRQERLLGHQKGSLRGKTDDSAISALPVPWKCQQEQELQICISCHCCYEVSCTPGAALSHGAPESMGDVSSPSWHL